MRGFGFLTAASAALLLCAASASAEVAAAARMLMAPTPAERVAARLLFAPEDVDAMLAAPADGRRRVVVTGAYSSGDRFAPEGFVIRRGEARNPRPQGWDGVLLIDAGGRLSLHNKRRVQHGGRRFDLTDRAERVAFLRVAAAEKLSAVQSHLLISDGALDLRESATPRRFLRRLLFQTADGAIGLYQSHPNPLSLYEAAVELKAIASPEMALNLDMGAYDFCEDRTADAVRRCGFVARNDMKKLTNLLELTLRP